jgi:hypothetical protein
VGAWGISAPAVFQLVSVSSQSPLGSGWAIALDAHSSDAAQSELTTNGIRFFVVIMFQENSHSVQKYLIITNKSFK